MHCTCPGYLVLSLVKNIRSARSMSSTFSTVMNFSVLGLLRRLHRLKIQSQLQAESYQSGIIKKTVINSCMIKEFILTDECKLYISENITEGN